MTQGHIRAPGVHSSRMRREQGGLAHRESKYHRAGDGGVLGMQQEGKVLGSEGGWRAAECPGVCCERGYRKE